MESMARAQNERVRLDYRKEQIANKLRDRANELANLKLSLRAILPNGTPAMVYTPNDTQLQNTAEVPFPAGFWTDLRHP